MVNESPIPREERPAIADHLAQRLVGPVGLDIWTQQESALVRTDRDPCTFCDQVAIAARQFASLHPGISLTRYDLDRHADRARESAVTLRFAAAFAMVMRNVRFQAIEVSEFPLLAEARMVAELPVLTIGGRRFTGGWSEADFAEQLRRCATGEQENVIRDRVLVSPFLTIEQAQAMSTGEAPPPDPQQPPMSPGGLVLPR